MSPSAKVVDRLSYVGAERRKLLRIHERFPARVRGEDSDGDRFELDAMLDNLGLQGLHMRLAREVGPGKDRFVSCVLAPRTIRACSRRGWPSKENVLRAEPQTEARMEWQFRFIAGGFYEPVSFW